MRLWKHDDDQRHGGQALVENRSETCAEHSGSRILRGRHESGRVPSRRGLGKTKHTELKYFWLQVATTSGHCPGGEEELLEGTEKTRIRSLAATLNYMSLDRSDVQYAAKEICTMMVNPTRRLEKVEEGM